MNVGLEHGLRNKFAEARAVDDKVRARTYVSTCYAVVAGISIVFFLFFIFINRFLDWTKILNTSLVLKENLSILACFVFGSFAATFVLKIITTILVADQKPSVLDLRNILEKIIKVLIILVLPFFSTGSLLILGIAYSVVPVVVLLLFSVFYFSRDYKDYYPSVKNVDFNCLKDLMSLGIKFFIISIGVVVLFTTDNIIITHLYGPESVVPYEVAKKYFSICLMMFMVFTQPLWSAVTNAQYTDDFEWIKTTVKKMLKVWVVFVVLSLVMLMLSDYVYKLWLGENVSVPFFLSLSWAIFVILQMCNTIFTMFVNGVGKVKVQMCTSIIATVINIPLSIFLAKILGFGLSGVIMATTASVLVGLIAKVVQYNKIINKNACGIWAQ